MKIKKTIEVIMEKEDRQKIIDFYNLVNEWVKDVEGIDAEEGNTQLYTDLIKLLYQLHNFLRDYT